MNGFRVLLDLSDFFSDYRGKSWVYIDPKQFKNIQSVKDHISKVFSIEEYFEIFLCGSYVPNTECINIILEGDVLQIQRSDRPHDNTMVIREAPICMQNNADKTREDEVIPEEKKKKSKKRKNVNDMERCVKDLSEVMDMPSLPEDFHPDYNSTMTPPKRRKSSHHSAELKASHESSILEEKMDLSKKKPIKEVKRVRETIEMVEDPEAASLCNEEESVNSPSCMDINENSNSSRGNENDSVINKLSESGHGDFTMKSDTVGISNISEIDGDSGLDALLSHHSLSRQSLLEHTIYNEVPHMVDDISETLKTASVPKKRKRNRSRRKKHKVGLTNLSTSSSQEKPLQYILPHSASPCEKSAATWHLRFSDSDEERISSAHEIAEGSKETALNGTSENRSISVDSQVKNLTGSVEKENVTKPYEENMKGQCNVEVVSLKDVCKIEVIEQQEVNEDNTASVKNFGEKGNEEHNSGEIESDVKEGTSEVASLKTKGNTTNTYVKRGRKAVLSTGLGETLAHLMKEVKTLGNDEALKKPCPPQPKKPDVEPPTPIITNQVGQRNKKDKRYKGFPILEKYPRKGDILAFKILKLNQHYEPCISDYIEGTVAVCDKDQSRLKVKILEGASELERRSGKLDLHLEEDDDTKEKNKIDDIILDLQWKDFIEPRLVFP